MTEVFRTLLIPSGIFLGSAVFAFAVFRIRHQLTLRQHAQLRPVGPLLLKARAGAFRSHFDRFENGTWIISAPLSRDSYVALQPGEEVLVDAPVEGGAMLFRTKILSRDAATHQYTIGLPERLHRTERREQRRRALEPIDCRLNGMPGRVLNHSREGALILSGLKLENGDLVIVQVGDQQVTGYALDSVYEAFGDVMGGLTRIRFQEPTRAFELR
ncbi:MAG: flagellar brake domain-containing protein [Chthonomonas sp.]|nr:flagellar brake domain-containing protein [Chthonomonas sp.]